MSWAQVCWHLCCCLWWGCAQAQTSGLPASVEEALKSAKLPREALSVVVLPVDTASAPRLQHLAEVQRNPSSLMKLVTTTAALDLLKNSDHRQAMLSGYAMLRQALGEPGACQRAAAQILDQALAQD